MPRAIKVDKDGSESELIKAYFKSEGGIQPCLRKSISVGLEKEKVREKEKEKEKKRRSCMLDYF